jgi:hypothetical protein
MKFLCLVHEEPDNGLGPQTESEAQALVNEHLDYDETLRQHGHWITAQALQPVETATTIRVRNGKISITDGPFAETKEVLGGFVLIEARDMDEAIQIAAGIPSARMGFIHVRRVYEFEKK